MMNTGHRADGTKHATLSWLRNTDRDSMDKLGDRYVELAKALGASDDEIDAALADNQSLGAAEDEIA